MTMNRVQFQPGLSMAEFMDRYGRDDQCEAALIESRWPSGFVCPACSCGQRSAFRREGRLYFQCTACRHQCSVISGTIFESTKLALSRWFLAMHLLTPVQDRRRRPRTHAPPGRLLQDRLAHQAQAHGGHARA